MFNKDDIKSIIVNYEERIIKLEERVNNLDLWLKKVDKKLDKISNDLYYLKGKFNGNCSGIENINKLNISWISILVNLISATIGGIIVLIAGGVIK